MVNQVDNQFLPNYTVLPGEILEEELESRDMSQAQLADRTGLAKKTINEIIKGKASITSETALKFEHVFNQSAQYWLNLEVLHQEAQARIAELERLEKDVDWLKALPIRKMINFGWIREFSDRRAQLWEVLNFYGIASVKQWEIVWSRYAVAYRKSPAFESQAEAISAWLRQGEIQAAQIDCTIYDAKRFKATLQEVRELTNETDPSIFVPRLQHLCASCGVAVVFIPELPKISVSGATHWVGKKAIIQLSWRHKSNDHLWFTFFHEAGHILLHGKKEVFVDMAKDNAGEKEEQANRFASEILIPETQYLKFKSQNFQFSSNVVTQFAAEVGIAPGIVAGRLQHDGLIAHRFCNELKVRYEWA